MIVGAIPSRRYRGQSDWRAPSDRSTDTWPAT